MEDMSDLIKVEWRDYKSIYVYKKILFVFMILFLISLINLSTKVMSCGWNCVTYDIISQISLLVIFLSQF